MLAELQEKKSTVILFTTYVATATRGHRLQLAQDRKLTNTILKSIGLLHEATTSMKPPRGLGGEKSHGWKSFIRVLHAMGRRQTHQVSVVVRTRLTG